MARRKVGFEIPEGMEISYIKVETVNGEQELVPVFKPINPNTPKYREKYYYIYFKQNGTFEVREDIWENTPIDKLMIQQYYWSLNKETLENKVKRANNAIKGIL